ERQAVGAGGEELPRRALGDAEAGGCVLGVDDHEIEAKPSAQVRQVGGQTVTACAADDISEEGETHVLRSWPRFLPNYNARTRRRRNATNVGAAPCLQDEQLSERVGWRRREEPWRAFQSPRTWISRWAPCDQAHEPGQGQLPMR